MTSGLPGLRPLLLGGAALIASHAAAQTPGGSTAGTAAAQVDAAAAPASPAVDAEGGLEDIVVTAERRESNLQSTPIAITAVTQAGLEARGIITINDLAANVPNLTATTGPQGSGDANFFVRGVGQFDFIVTADPGIGLYVDGVYLGRTVGAALDSGDIARVEVLRGPQGTLFGRNTLGGAISITSVAPDPEAFSGSLRGTLGSRERIDVDGGVNVPLGETAALRAFGYTRNQDGFATSVNTGLEYGKTKRYGGNLALRFEPSDGFTIDLRADYTRDKSNPAPSVLRAIVPAPFFPADAATEIQDRSRFYRIFSSNSDEADNEVYGFSANLAYDLGDITLRSITAYRELEGFSTSDPDGTGYRLYDQATTTEQNQFSQELQLAGSLLDDRLDVLLGGYYFREKSDQLLALCFAPIFGPPPARGNPCATWNQGNRQKTTSYAVFGQARYNFTEEFSVTLGGRYTWEDKDIVSNQSFDFTALGGPVAPIVTDLRDSADFKKFTPKVGVEYKIPDLLLFASYAKGFRSGGFNGRLIVPQSFVPSYAPDTNDSYEAGFKADLAGRTLRVNGTAFYSMYEGIQQTISVPDVQFRVANAGDAELYGFELEVTAIPLDGLQLDLGIGYTHSEFKNVPANVGPINGNSLPFSPRLTFNAGVEYAFDLSDTATLTPRVNVRYQSRTYFTAFNLPLETQGRYALVDARLTLTLSERYSIAAYGLNLTDKEYYTFGQNALGAQGVAYNYIGRPREFGVTAGVKF